ncbi:hypothetical protein ABW20_dc0103218 [Dactylellina cionopaga]|nr:hypothetical protein ABW20_dc0103218 [Dactylellina cionopaga]
MPDLSNHTTNFVPSCPAAADASFGPVIKGCRDDFDFTFTFEQYIFVIAPSAVGLVLGAIRIGVLKGRKDVVRGGTLRLVKLVSVAAGSAAC